MEAKFEKIKKRWLELWPKALLTWSRYIILREPIFLFNMKEVKRVGIGDNIAAVSMADLGIHINLPKIINLGLEECGHIILAHEIGHHVICPNSVVNMARLVNIMKPVFGNIEQTRMMENLYGDLLINDRLYLSRKLPIPNVYKLMMKNDATLHADLLWKFYMRVYETMWYLPRGSLAGENITKNMDMDAGIATRIIRIFSNRWMRAAKKIAYVFQPYFPPLEKMKQALMPNLDTEVPGEGAEGKIYGLTQIDQDEIDAAADEGPFPIDLPSLDEIKEGEIAEARAKAGKPGGGQHRTPAQYGQILKNIGLKLKPNEEIIKYYKELASPNLIPLPKVKRPGGGDAYPEATDIWFIGEEYEKLDWTATILESPIIFPNLTTRKRMWAEDKGSKLTKLPVDLDIYIDSSGSMPNPRTAVSYLTLAGVILALSALRAGAKVQVTVWSGYGQFASTLGKGGFINDEKILLTMLCKYFGDGTGFPLNVLRDTYNERKSEEPPAHIIVISDDGVDTMLLNDEKGKAGKKISKESLDFARGGGTLLLNLSSQVKSYPKILQLKKLGYEIYRVTNWNQLVDFARDFSVKTYGDL
ncbi:MAG: VWA domain-containing protein [Candidatus Helarchaeota archaeon]|nr:VWA domain-containing protein [Candidatus Helarchaeota archaeon]